jgi:hypothetical protein
MFQFRNARTAFLRLLAKYLKRHSIPCYTFSFTINHYYLVLRSTDEAISIFMQELNSAFAKKFNRLNRRFDAVLGRRFDSLIAKETIGLTELIRFVNLEPVRQNNCTIDQLDHSGWSGHSAILGYRQKVFIERSAILNQFTAPDSIDAYREFIRSGYPEQKDDEILKLIRRANSGKGEQTILGDADYISMIQQMSKSAYSRIKRHVSENVKFQQIHRKVAALFCLEKEELFYQGRQNVKSTARELFAYIARKRYDFSNTEIAGYLRVCKSAISRMISRFENIVQKEFLKKELELVYITDVEPVPI